MTLNRDIRLVSLDLDDTLIDTWGSVPARVRYALLDVAPKLGVRITADRVEAIAAAIADGEPDTRAVRFASMVGLDEADERLEPIQTAYSYTLELMELLPDAAAVLRTLRRHLDVVITTNGRQDIQEQKLQLRRLDGLVDAVFASGGVGASKPDPAIFQYVSDTTGHRAEHIIHIGDSLATDVLGANRAGWASVHLRTNVPHPPPMPVPVPGATLDSLAELPALLGID